MSKFSGCGCRFNPGLSETEEIRMVCFSNIRQVS